MPGFIRVLLSLALAGGMAAATTAAALACTCAPVSEKQAFASADVVLVGVVVGTDDPAVGLPVISTGDPILYTVRVDELLKGEAGAEVTVRTARHGASCGLGMSVGQRWRLYAHRDDVLQVSLCGRNELLSEGFRLPDSAPIDGSVPGLGWLLLLPGLAGAMIAALALAALRFVGRG